MTQVAAEVADGFFTHPFHTARSWKETTLPALERGVAASGRNLKDIDICFQLMVVSGHNDEELEQCANIVRQQIGFYGSTPAYRVMPREPRLGRCPDRAQCDVQEGRLGRDESPHHGRHSRADRRRGT